MWHQSRPCVVMRDMRPQFERATIRFLDEDVVKRKVPASELMSGPEEGAWREEELPSGNAVTSGARPAHLELLLDQQEQAVSDGDEQCFSEDDLPISSMSRDGALPAHTQRNDNFIQPTRSLDPSCTVVRFMETPRWARFEVQDQVPGDGLRSWVGLQAMYHCMCGYATVSRRLMEGHECCGRYLGRFEDNYDLFDYGACCVDRWDIGGPHFQACWKGCGKRAYSDEMRLHLGGEVDG